MLQIFPSIFNPSSGNNSNTINISVVGMNGSGKSAEKYAKCDHIDGQEVHLMIQDTTDSDNIDLKQLLAWANVVIVVFSITSRRSFYRAQELVEAIHALTTMLNVNGGNLNTLLPPRSSAFSSRTSSPAGHGPGNFGTGDIQESHSTASSIQNTVTNAFTSRLGTGSLKRSQVGNIVSTQMMLVANKADLERFRLVQRHEAEKVAREYNIQLMDATVTEDYSLVEEIFHRAVKLWLDRSTNNGILGCDKAAAGNIQFSAKQNQMSRASPLRDLSLSSFMMPKKVSNVNNTVLEHQELYNHSPISDSGSTITLKHSGSVEGKLDALGNEQATSENTHTGTLPRNMNKSNLENTTNGNLRKKEPPPLPPSASKKQTSGFRFFKKK